MCRKCNFLFIGGVFLKENINMIGKYSKGAVQNAANVLQWNYINGFESNMSINVDIINSVYVGTYPKYFSKMFVDGAGDFIDDMGRNIYDVGFINLPIIADKMKYLYQKRNIKKWLENHDGTEMYVIAYGMFEHNIKMLSYVKKHSNAITCLIVPDLPQYMSLSKRFSFIKKYINKQIYKLFRKEKRNIDFYALTTKQMGGLLELSSECYVVIDGMVDVNNEEINYDDWKTSTKCFTFLYTGGLSHSYGIDVLVDSFLKMRNKNTELWICGDGPYANELIEICKRERRIRYWGMMTRDECVNLQRKATCLINPRQESEITQYSFPSKTMEYLLSGRPVIAKRLEGMDHDYEKLFYSFNDTSDLADVMDRVSNMEITDLNIAGIRGRNYVIEKKNNKYQTNKLINLLMKNYHEH